MEFKVNKFSKKDWIKIGDDLLSLKTPLVMGILNTTPDSFYDGGKYSEIDIALKRVEEMIEQQVDILDIGGYSSRPGAENIEVNEELNRVVPIIQKVREKFPNLPISVDTFRSRVASEAIECGVHMVNDISGGELDDEMFNTIAKFNVPYVLMHMKGNPENMQNDPKYDDVVSEVKNYFSDKIKRLRELGVKDIVIDPGFGFGKNLEHNYQLMRHLEELQIFELPIMIGVSRKSMINKVLKTTPANAGNGTTVLQTIALLQGANIVRTHDVRAAKETVKILMQLQKT